MAGATDLAILQLRTEMAQLQKEVGRLRDLEEIRSLVARYGPAVDRGDSRTAANLWVEEGIYDLGPDWPRIEGREAIMAIEEGPEHLGLIGGGAAHFLSSPAITLAGDTAVAVCHSLVLRWTGEGFELYRVSANHMTLRRTEEGWRIVERKNRLLKGSAEARALLAL